MKAKLNKLWNNKKFSSVRNQLVKPLPVYGSLLLASLVIFSVKLTSLVPFSIREVPEFLGSASLSHIKNDILFAPTKTMQFLILKFGDNDLWLRASSVAAAVFAAILMYIMLRKWYTARVSFITIVMFITSSFTLHSAGITNHEVLYLWVIPMLLLSCLWFLSKQNDKKLPVASLFLAVILYIPGSWLLILAGAIAFRKFIYRNVQKISKKLKLTCLAIFAAFVTPLIYSLAINPSQIPQWLGFNTSQDLTPQNIAMNFVNIADQLVARGLQDAGNWVVGTPILDVFSVVMLYLGIYAYRAGYYPAREKLVFGTLILGILIIGIGNVATIALIIPIVYILIANGIAYMLQSWFTVFPKNPFARSVGVVLLSVVVAFSCFYNIQRYFVAWPNADATHEALKQRS